jgi:hypothetical protein
MSIGVHLLIAPACTHSSAIALGVDRPFEIPFSQGKAATGTLNIGKLDTKIK